MGVKEHPLYRRWRFIVDITTNENDPNYKSYAGGQGIENHFNNFDEFRKYITRKLGLPKPPYNHLHRKDREDHFRPGNLVWATAKQVGRNQRNNVYITHKGKTRCLTEWSEIYGIPYGRVVERLKADWTFEQAMGIKPGPRKQAHLDRIKEKTRKGIK
ncbi:hypothetical protein UFOVP94_19 [uncultured Caudovirales phage]|uniref:Uncharacterized protein n=1 Tax=uncultured Caudovirales phage TaxID=2100421 RepID=A0A6J5L2Z6_9CAUD|nr:hypothetical protein UFOVP94_19 [uncultured Caudovirales phage]CAB5212514.1 hypothetical protein UFOVP186_24 [uncultured Caudovirales phage]